MNIKIDKPKKRHENVSFRTDNGSFAELIWEKNEYKVYINGQKANYGAVIPDRLADFVKKML